MKAVTELRGNFATGPASIMVSESPGFTPVLLGRRYAITRRANSSSAKIPRPIQSVFKNDLLEGFWGNCSSLIFFLFFSDTDLPGYKTTYGQDSLIPDPLNHIPAIVKIMNDVRKKQKTT